jgi:hypothetical protein
VKVNSYSSRTRQRECDLPGTRVDDDHLGGDPPAGFDHLGGVAAQPWARSGTRMEPVTFTRRTARRES